MHEQKEPLIQYDEAQPLTPEQIKFLKAMKRQDKITHMKGQRGHNWLWKFKEAIDDPSL